MRLRISRRFCFFLIMTRGGICVWNEETDGIEETSKIAWRFVFILILTRIDGNVMRCFLAIAINLSESLWSQLQLIPFPAYILSIGAVWAAVVSRL